VPLRVQGFARVRPPEGLGEDGIEVPDEADEALAKIVERAERGTLTYLGGEWGYPHPYRLTASLSLDG
jgi:hypothetical protein